MLTSKTIRVFAVTCLACVLTGCGGKTVRGTVVGAPIGRAVVVDARDERLTQPGLAGIELKLVRPGTDTSGGIAPLATAVTDDTGRFTMRLKNADKVRGQLVILAEGDGALRSSTRIYPPRDGQEILVHIRERRSSGADGSTE